MFGCALETTSRRKNHTCNQKFDMKIVDFLFANQPVFEGFEIATNGGSLILYC
jgi:hypothetical protein